VNGPAAASPDLTIVIPSWRDSDRLAELLPKLAQLKGSIETVIVDACDDERSQELAAAAGATFLRADQPNRGAQMNIGAECARGEILLFHHADTELSQSHIDAIHRAMQDPPTIGGAFYRKFDGRHPRLQWMEHVARFLARNGGTLFGDQSIFVRRAVFARLGGFATIPLMEDVEFSRRLRRTGKIGLLDPPIGTSSRRHDRRGAWRTSIQNGLFIVLYRLGVSPHRLHQWYYGDRTEGRSDPTPTVTALSSRR
jgi:rSAM/selenodomain-associated transferase 2